MEGEEPDIEDLRDEVDEHQQKRARPASPAWGRSSIARVGNAAANQDDGANGNAISGAEDIEIVNSQSTRCT